MSVKRFEDLEVWQEARELCKIIYDLTTTGFWARDFALKNQIRRSSGSVMDNIAEGFGRGGNKEFINFLSIAMGSTSETRSQIYRAFDAGYIPADRLNDLLERTEKIVKRGNALISYLKSSDMKGSKYYVREE